MIEPVQGEGGFLVAPLEFMEGVRAICDRHGIVLVVDEVQTGFGAHRQAVRDRALRRRARPRSRVAKSIAGGLPLSGVIGKAEIMDAPGDSAIGGTYVGNPVAQAAALAVLDVIEEEGLCERAAALGETMRARMQAWQERWPQIGDVRGLGAMLAIELVLDPETKEPAPELATAVVEQAARARPPAAQVRDLLELHPRAHAARARPTPSSTRLSASGKRRSSSALGA